MGSVHDLRSHGDQALSHETDESTSPERQQEQTRGYCGPLDWDIAHVSMDVGVSEAISPFDVGSVSHAQTAGQRVESRRQCSWRCGAGLAPGSGSARLIPMITVKLSAAVAAGLSLFALAACGAGSTSAAAPAAARRRGLRHEGHRLARGPGHRRNGLVP